LPFLFFSFYFGIFHHFLFLAIFLGYDPLDTFSIFLIFLVSLLFRCLRLMNS
jgi:hypothetical protein